MIIDVVIGTQENTVVEDPNRILAEVITERSITLLATQGPRGVPGPEGPPGVYDGTVADASPDPVLLFENNLI